MTTESPNSQQVATDPVVAELIAGLEQYRQRIVDESTALAKKLKLPKKQVMARLDGNEEIARIDAKLAELRGLKRGANA